jgi:hypothetical protein
MMKGATSHRRKWGPLPLLNEISRITHHVMKGEGRKVGQGCVF